MAEKMENFLNSSSDISVHSDACTLFFIRHYHRHINLTRHESCNLNLTHTLFLTYTDLTAMSLKAKDDLVLQTDNRCRRYLYILHESCCIELKFR